MTHTASLDRAVAAHETTQHLLRLPTWLPGGRERGRQAQAAIAEARKALQVTKPEVLLEHPNIAARLSDQHLIEVALLLIESSGQDPHHGDLVGQRPTGLVGTWVGPALRVRSTHLDYILGAMQGLHPMLTSPTASLMGIQAVLSYGEVDASFRHGSWSFANHPSTADPLTAQVHLLKEVEIRA